MSSSSRPPRSRYRFGFRGKRPARNAQASPTDEILDSLTRQARLMEKAGEERTLGLQTILEVEPGEELLHSLSLPESSPKVTRPKTWSFGKSAFGVMLIGGLTPSLDLLQTIAESQSAKPGYVTADGIASRIRRLAEDRTNGLLCPRHFTFRSPIDKQDGLASTLNRLSFRDCTLLAQTNRQRSTRQSPRGSPGEIRTPVSR